MLSTWYNVDGQVRADAEKYHAVLNHIGSGKRILELGCYDGSFSRVLMQQGNRVTGVDSDQQALVAADAFCDRAIHCDLDQLNSLDGLGLGRFDFVLMMDVLEHLRDPEQLLRFAKGHLSPGGSVVITLPNIAFWGIRRLLLLGNFNYTDVGILDRTHLRFFTYFTGRDLIEHCGYRVVESRGISCVLPLGSFLRHAWLRPVRSWWAAFGRKIEQAHPNFACMQMLFVAVDHDASNS
jgi:SAM-dependent methyltransferase